MEHNTVIYILIMAGVTYLIRVIPLTLIRREIRNPIIRSFLFYVPYITLAVMTFPDIIHATQTPISGMLALIFGAVLAWLGASLFKVSAFCCVVVFVAERFLVG